MTEMRTIPFGEILRPWAQDALRALEAQAGSLLRRLQRRALADLESALVLRWSATCAPLLAHKLQEMRSSGKLRGRTPQERFRDFSRRLDKKTFFHAHPLLASLHAFIRTFWIESTVEWLQRLEEDERLLRKTFNQGRPLGAVASLRSHLGDPHCRGRTSCLARFSSGISLIYKPRALDGTCALFRFIEELNRLGLSPELQGYRILPRKGYGWEEVVRRVPCTRREEVHRYFTRAGVWLSLLYLFGGSDIHLENLIAHGEHPVPIDLETLFRPALHDAPAPREEEVFMHSVLTTGLLPFFLDGKPGVDSLDISGLFAADEALSPFQTAFWDNFNTDAMCIAYEQGRLEKREHRPLLKNIPQNPLRHCERVVKGFNAAYTLLERHKHHLTPFLEKVAAHPVRFLLRHTSVYYEILKERARPDALCSERSLARLDDLLQGRNRELFASIVAQEKTSLTQGDIPYFSCIPREAHLCVNGALLLKNAFKRPPYLAARERLEHLGDADRRTQETFIRQAFHAKRALVHRGGGAALHAGAPQVTKEEIRCQALLIADALRRSAYRSPDGSLGWIGVSADPLGNYCQVRPLKENFYSEKGGIALFFAALGCKEEALGCLSGIRRLLHGGKTAEWTERYGLGGMTGLGGACYALHTCGKLLAEPTLTEEAQALALSPFSVEDSLYDVVRGSAGFLLVLLSLYEATKEPALLASARACGRHLCTRAIDLNGAYAWQTTSDTRPLLGFSHGTAGIAYALLKLSHLTQREEWLPCVQGALAYERRCFSRKKRNWPFFTGGRSRYLAQWCHGAAGIGLSRLAMRAYLADETFPEEIADALAAVLAHPLEACAPTLCCGGLGRLEFLRESAVHNPSLAPEADLLAARLLERLRTGAKRPSPPGFMKGSAGQGYTLLRLLDPSLPQTLLLQ
jgi:type 2 lantibiotic biosynthesis protein LanM